MKAILTLYVRLFLVFSVIFGLLTFLLALVGPETLDLNRTIYKALFFGICMSLFLGTIHILALKRMGLKSITSDDIGVVQHRRVLSNLNFSQIVDKLKSIPFTRKMETSDSGQSLTIHTGASWKSWGETIKIVSLQETEKGMEYEIISQPKIRTTLVDNGRNLQNVMRIEELLNYKESSPS